MGPQVSSLTPSIAKRKHISTGPFPQLCGVLPWGGVWSGWQTEALGAFGLAPGQGCQFPNPFSYRYICRTGIQKAKGLLLLEGVEGWFTGPYGHTSHCATFCDFLLPQTCIADCLSFLSILPVNYSSHDTSLYVGLSFPLPEDNSVFLSCLLSLLKREAHEVRDFCSPVCLRGPGQRLAHSIHRAMNYWANKQVPNKGSLQCFCWKNDQGLWWLRKFTGLFRIKSKNCVACIKQHSYTWTFPKGLGGPAGPWGGWPAFP